MALTPEDLQAIASLLDKRLEPVSQRLETMQDDIKAVKITLENEVQRDINLIRESQLGQARNMDDVVSQVNSIENKLENSVIVKAVTTA